jgi:radical SAM superfamily enzyme YgiQ (UPF0313 family)
MKRAGCWIIAFGVESGNQEILEHIRKKATVDQAREAVALCHEVGIKSSIYLLMGLPWDTPQTLTDNVNLAKEIRPDFVEIFYPYPFPGTELHRIALEKGLIKPGEIPEEAYAHPAMRGYNMTQQELADWRRKSLRQLYLRPSYIWQTLRGVRSPAELFQYIKYGALTLKDLTFGKPKMRGSATD